MGETRKRLDSEGPATFRQLFQEFASAVVANESSDAIDNANIKRIATKEEVTISLKKKPIERDTRVFEENVIETRSNSPASETIVCVVEEIYQTLEAIPLGQVRIRQVTEATIPMTEAIPLEVIII